MPYPNDRNMQIFSFYTRMMGQQNLSILHAKLTASLSESKCSLIPCLPNLLSIQHVPAARTFFCTIPLSYPSKGVWGRCPHVYPLPFFPFWVFSIKKSLCYLSMIHKLFLNSKRGMGAVPPCLPIALDLALKNP